MPIYTDQELLQPIAPDMEAGAQNVPYADAEQEARQHALWNRFYAETD